MIPRGVHSTRASFEDKLWSSASYAIFHYMLCYFIFFACRYPDKLRDDSAVLFNSIYSCQILTFIHSFDLSSYTNYTTICIFIAKNNVE